MNSSKIMALYPKNRYQYFIIDNISDNFKLLLIMVFFVLLATIDFDIMSPDFPNIWQCFPIFPNFVTIFFHHRSGKHMEKFVTGTSGPKYGNYYGKKIKIPYGNINNFPHPRWFSICFHLFPPLLRSQELMHRLDREGSPAQRVLLGRSSHRAWTQFSGAESDGGWSSRRGECGGVLFRGVSPHHLLKWEFPLLVGGLVAMNFIFFH